MNPFEQIPNIIERRRAFLEEMCGHYNLTNRAHTITSGCVYEPTVNSAGCAIGRWCPETHYKSGTVKSVNICSVLPKWMTDMNVDFLRDCQLMHDGEENWTRTGLSASGLVAKNIIYATYCHETIQETNAG